MFTCPHTPIEPTLDRWQECHWHIHQMEAHYHDPEPFRYSVNSFIRAAKEVPLILMADLERHPEVRKVINTQLEQLKRNPLFATLQTQRNFLVHRGMLDLQSRGSVGRRKATGQNSRFRFPFLRTRLRTLLTLGTKRFVGPKSFGVVLVLTAIQRRRYGVPG